MAEPVKTHITPNGMELAHYEKPYWSYTINGEHGHPWTPEEPYGRVPSVTGINGVLDKSAPLMHYAANMTFDACAYLTQTFGVPPAQMVPPHIKARWTKQKFSDDATKVGAQVLKRTAKHYKIDHTSNTEEAQFRGSAIHLIGERWIKEGAFPVLSEYPKAWRGYVRAIAGFLSAWKGDFKMAEVITGSAKHGYAGTCDTVAVVTGTDGLTARLDYKTSKQVYARTHFRQLEAYEFAAVEGGEDPTDRRGIVCLYENGEHEVVYVPLEHMGPRAFLNVLAVWRDEQPLKRLEDAAYKARKVREGR